MFRKGSFVDVVPSEATLELPDFSVMDYMNSMFPNEQALKDMDYVMGKITTKIQRYDEDIQKEVRVHMRDKERVQSSVKQAHKTIGSLRDKIEEIKDKATESALLADKICKDIIILDRAKNNLAASITTMRRLKMVFDAMVQLQDKANQRQYKAVADLLGALELLVSAFLPYKDLPCVQDLLKTRDQLRELLDERVIDEFERYETMRVERGEKEEDMVILRDVCCIIETLGDVTRRKFVSWFVKEQLFDYKQAYRLDSPASQLDSVERRYAWLRREFIYLDETYVNIFPDHWQMAMNVASEFCLTTKSSFTDLLEAQKNTLNVVLLVNTAKSTIEFEKDLSEKFPVNNFSTDTQEDDDESEYIHDDEETGGSTSSRYSVESITKKWIKFKQLQQMKEKQKQLKISKQQETSPVAENVQFKGMISSCFEPYLETIYIQQEETNVKEILDQLMKEETWDVGEEESNKILSSAMHLIYYLNEARKRCVALSRGNTFFQLFLLFKKYLGIYAQELSNKIGDNAVIDSQKPLAEQEEKTICYIVNTADYCGKTTAQITSSVAKAIEERFREKLDLAQEAESFSVVTSKALKALANNLEVKLIPSLNAMSKMKWGDVQIVGEQSSYISQIDTILQECAPKLREYFEQKHFQYICDAFVSSFVDRHVIPHLYKCKRVSEYGAQQLSVDFATLKVTLLELAGNPPARRYTKLVSKEIGKIEAILKLLFVPNEGIVDAYFALNPNGTEEELERVLKMKGTKREEKNRLTQMFRTSSTAAINPPVSGSPHGSPSILPRSSSATSISSSSSLSSLSSLSSSLPSTLPPIAELPTPPPTPNFTQTITLKKLSDLVVQKKVINK